MRLIVIFILVAFAAPSFARLQFDPNNPSAINPGLDPSGHSFFGFGGNRPFAFPQQTALAPNILRFASGNPTYLRSIYEMVTLFNQSRMTGNVRGVVLSSQRLATMARFSPMFREFADKEGKNVDWARLGAQLCLADPPLFARAVGGEFGRVTPSGAVQEPGAGARAGVGAGAGGDSSPVTLTDKGEEMEEEAAEMAKGKRTKSAALDSSFNIFGKSSQSKIKARAKVSKNPDDDEEDADSPVTVGGEGGEDGVSPVTAAGDEIFGGPIPEQPGACPQFPIVENPFDLAQNGNPFGDEGEEGQPGNGGGGGGGESPGDTQPPGGSGGGYNSKGGKVEPVKIEGPKGFDAMPRPGEVPEGPNMTDAIRKWGDKIAWDFNSMPYHNAMQQQLQMFQGSVLNRDMGFQSPYGYSSRPQSTIRNAGKLMGMPR